MNKEYLLLFLNAIVCFYTSIKKNFEDSYILVSQRVSLDKQKQDFSTYIYIGYI